MDGKLTQPHQLGSNFANLVEGGSVKAVPVSDSFWSEGIAELDPGRLVSKLAHETDWSNWEMHPNGDELIFGLSGRIAFILERQYETETLELGEGEFLIVPKGVWHTANVIEPGAALYITAGEGTQNRPR